MDHNVINLRTMEQTSLLQPVMAGREVRRELGADGTGVSWRTRPAWHLGMVREQRDPWAGCINRRREASSEVGGLALHSRAVGSHLETCLAPFLATET